MIRAVPVKSRIRRVEWSLFNPKVFLLITESEQLQVYNYETSELVPFPIPMTFVSAARWHPRKKDFIVYGTNIGNVHLCNFLDSKEPNISRNYEGPKISTLESLLDGDDDQDASVVDIAINPGEDVFLVAFNNRSLLLFSESEFTPKVVFERQQ